VPHDLSHDDDVGAGNQLSAAACSLGRQQAEPGRPGPLPHRPDPDEAGAAEVPDEQRPVGLAAVNSVKSPALTSDLPLESL
jgi:hypothetical protein